MTPPSPTTRREPVTVRAFAQRFSSTPRGARLARRLALHRLDAWGVPYGSEASDTAALLVAELARIEVSDTRGERRPPAPGAARTAPPSLAETGRGLLLVEALADRWEVLDRLPVGKTVVAELDLPGWTGPDRRADMP
ncbi:ATP-binding protein [Streptomyces sp. Root369]|uniref:ATP-binding protein n=1 Tax=Streptomyces sp. Root369 TaxID=1736523 RepID=UPI00070C9B2F|nr:ATP-binding protein [Streptomyces sp. Root369]KQW03239.1 hypothetical protein ASD08_44855 [Streptomyces sp. Root369]